MTHLTGNDVIEFFLHKRLKNILRLNKYHSNSLNPKIGHFEVENVFHIS